ncbi:MAG TPA: LytTR family transcriptional regulator [Mogibacterium sp.]|nr:LytTR family transcriptional regulator [Mogibacterium sp.]
MSKEMKDLHIKGRERPEYISIVTGSKCAKIKIEDIEIIEQEGRKIHIVTADKDYSLYATMNSIAVHLEGRSFYRAMKGLIVNFNHVKDIEGFYVNFFSGQCVTMGRNNIAKTKMAFKQYLKQYPPFTSWEAFARVAEKDK